MRKSLKRGSLALGAILALNACGGSSATTETAEAYYLDSAVAGVNYKCGSLEGITDEEGKFSFEKGQACVFSLGEIFLRAMDSTLLVEGKKIVEENLTVATVLQSLDNDGDPSNGITITKEVINAFESAVKEVSDALVIPQTVEHLETVVATIENNVTDFKGYAVSQEDALAHLQTTEGTVTKELLAGKTFYIVVNLDESDGSSPELEKMEINSDASSVKFTHLETGNITEQVIEIDGDKFIFLDDDGEYSIVSQADGYIYFDDRYADGSKDGIGHRLYTNEADAKKYLDSLSSGDTESITKFSTEWLNGKTLYDLYEDDDGWYITAISFTDTTLSAYDIDNPEDSLIRNYTVTSEGYLSAYNDEQEEDWLVIRNTYDTYLEVCDTRDKEELSNCLFEEEYLYYTLADAKAARDSK